MVHSVRFGTGGDVKLYLDSQVCYLVHIPELSSLWWSEVRSSSPVASRYDLRSATSPRDMQCEGFPFETQIAAFDPAPCVKKKKETAASPHGTRNSLERPQFRLHPKLNSHYRSV